MDGNQIFWKTCRRWQRKTSSVVVSNIGAALDNADDLVLGAEIARLFTPSMLYVLPAGSADRALSDAEVNLLNLQ